jgi:hypothetical protein
MGACQAGKFFSGVVGLESLDTDNCSKTSGSLVQATNTIIAKSITKTIMDCANNALLVQKIRITCKPVEYDENGNSMSVYEENESCGYCMAGVQGNFLYQNELEERMWTQASSARVRQPIDSMYKKLAMDLEICGLSYCKACVLLNTTQKNIVSSESGCTSSVSKNDEITTNVSNLIKQQLTQNQDVLTATVKELGVKGVDNISQNISNKISKVLTKTFLNKIASSLQSIQSVTLTSSTSVTSNNLTQNSIEKFIITQVSQMNIAEQALTKSTFENIEASINNQNTLNEIGDLVFKSSVSFAQAIDTSIGKVMISVLILLGTAFLCIVGYIIYKKFQRGINVSLKNQEEQKLNRSKLSAWAEF